MKLETLLKELQITPRTERTMQMKGRTLINPDISSYSKVADNAHPGKTNTSEMTKRKTLVSNLMSLLLLHCKIADATSVKPKRTIQISRSATKVFPILVKKSRAYTTTIYNPKKAQKTDKTITRSKYNINSGLFIPKHSFVLKEAKILPSI